MDRNRGSYLHEEIARPVDAKFFVGLPATGELRVARLISFVGSLASDRTLRSLDDLVPALAGPDTGDDASTAATYLATDGPRSFGRIGLGGSVGWADPDQKLGLGFVMNQMEIGMTGDKRSCRLMKASLPSARQAS